jgi:cytochrome c oxidase cbb3-type subunit 3
MPLFVRQLSILAVLTVLGAAAPSCKREERSFHMPPPSAELSEAVPLNNPVRPGPLTPRTESTSQPVSLVRLTHEPYGGQYPKNAQALSDGQLFYEMFNCVGCHAHGGGGIGPPLLDRKWLYGSEPEQVYMSIVQGRPNGMPSFRGRIPDYQVWEIVAYVRSMSGQASQNAASGREDHMSAQPPPNSMPKETPQTVPAPATGPAGGAPSSHTPTTKPATQPTSTTKGA